MRCGQRERHASSSVKVHSTHTHTPTYHGHIFEIIITSLFQIDMSTQVIGAYRRAQVTQHTLVTSSSTKQTHSIQIEMHVTVLCTVQ